MATNNSPSICGVCHDDFDEGVRCPRIFICSHTLCHLCIEKLIAKNKKVCPFCRQPFKADSVKDITLNHNTLEFMRYLGSEKVSGNLSQRGRSASRQDIIQEMKKETLVANCRHLFDCQALKMEGEKTFEEIMKLQVTITEENVLIETDVLPKFKDILDHNRKLLDELIHTSHALDQHMKVINSSHAQLGDVKKKLEACTAGKYSEISGVLDEAEDVHLPIAAWLRDFKESLFVEEGKLTLAEKDVEETKKSVSATQEALNLREERRTILPHRIHGHFGLYIQEEALTQLISGECLIEMLPPVKLLVEQGMVFALQELAGKQRFGRISLIPDQQIALHHFRDEPIPSNAHYVQYNEIVKLEDVSTRLTFLELSNTSGSSLGRVYIRLTANLRRGQQFAMLCTAENGPCYANTRVLGVTSKGTNQERLHFGDYEKNDGSGGMSLIKGVENDLSGEYLQPWTAGRVSGRWMSEPKGAQFFIYTGNRPEYMVNGSFAVVEKGLQVLSTAVLQHPNVKDIVISDCGIVLSF